MLYLCFSLICEADVNRDTYAVLTKYITLNRNVKDSSISNCTYKPSTAQGLGELGENHTSICDYNYVSERKRKKKSFVVMPTDN